jgi:AbrB family looped-hinge helix DNA binding protein
MKTTIDSGGRVVIPKAIRDSLGLAVGEELEVRERDGRIEMEPVGRKVWLEERGGRLVAVTEEPAPVLTVDDVRAVVERLRR